MVVPNSICYNWDSRTVSLDIYVDNSNKEKPFYVRLNYNEKPPYMHGLAFATFCATAEEAASFRKMIAFYLELVEIPEEDL